MQMLKNTLLLAALAEAATGAALIIVPSLVGELLLGEVLTGSAITIARVAGVALLALGLACWPGMQRAGMLLYSSAIMLFLFYLALTGDSTGALIWPAIILHLLISISLFKSARSSVSA